MMTWNLKVCCQRLLLALLPFGMLPVDAVGQTFSETNESPLLAELAIDSQPLADQYDPAIRLAQAPSFPSDDPLGVNAQENSQSILPPGTRPGVYQGQAGSYYYMPRLEGDSLGFAGIETSVKFGLPFPRRETPLVITPRYQALFLDGPDFTDVPPRVHEAELGLQHFRKLNDRWLFNGAITLGMYADDHSFDSDDAFRVTGRALGIYELTSQWKGLIGVVYLNRAGYSVIPAAGLMYDRGDLKVDLIFPRPRIARLIEGTPDSCEQTWRYLMLELGGNIWAVNREDGREDNLSYGDVRLLWGTENKKIGGVSNRTEIGYIFNRELEYESEGYETELDDSLILRSIFSY